MDCTRDRLTATLLGLAALGIAGCLDAGGPAAPPTGSIEIMVTTTGPAEILDPDGYVWALDGRPGATIGVNAAATIGPLSKGLYRISLDGLADHCSAGEHNPLWVSLPSSHGRAIAVFQVICYAGDGDSGAGGWDYSRLPPRGG